MGYHVVDPGSLAPTPDFPCDRRPIAEAADLETVAAAQYTIEPGEQLAREYHFHDQREELFYVLAGTLHVRTPEATFQVAADEVFVAEPGSPHLPHVPTAATEPARVLGVGAPAFDPGKPYDPEDEAE